MIGRRFKMPLDQLRKVQFRRRVHFDTRVDAKAETAQLRSKQRYDDKHRVRSSHLDAGQQVRVRVPVRDKSWIRSGPIQFPLQPMSGETLSSSRTAQCGTLEMSHPFLLSLKTRTATLLFLPLWLRPAVRKRPTLRRVRLQILQTPASKARTKQL
jgi:hypothetical protein